MRPPILCKLQKGVLIDANPGFVDTFNWMVDFINNICGDGDLDRTKQITVDKTIDDRPVIRSKGGGGGGGDAPDNVSLDLRDADDYTADGKLQIKDWDHTTPPAATTTIAEDLAGNGGDTLVARQDSDKALKYKQSGVIASGSDSNVSIGTDNGNLTIDVYYK